MVLNLPLSMATGRSPMETCQDCWQPSPGLHASQPFPTVCCYQNGAGASPLLVGLYEQWLHPGPKKLITFNNLIMKIIINLDPIMQWVHSAPP